MKPATILLRGDGVAVATPAHLLNRAGMEVVREAGRRRPVPAIMLSDQALALLRDVFGNPGLFARQPRITHRVVRWGGPDAMVMPHGAVVVSQADLAAALDPPSAEQRSWGDAPEPDFAVYAMPPFPVAETLCFGERVSATARVTLRADAAPATCWIEAVETGWLFLIPDPGGEGPGADGPNKAWLLAVGGSPELLVQQAPLIAPLIDTLEPAGAVFDTSPRMLKQMAGPGWLACGTAAIAFDPICGDGTAQAAREGILASAVVAALARGGDPVPLATHYHSLLLAALRRHLQLSLPFYASGGAHRWWHDQYAAAKAGYDCTTALLSQLPEPRFVLHGFDLLRREAAA